MALADWLKRGKKNGGRGRSHPQRLELKNSARKSPVNKKLRRSPPAKKNNAAFGAAAWGKMRGPLAWFFAMAMGLLLFFGASVGLLYAYNFFTTSQYFAVKTIEIDGQNRLKSREVIEIAGLRYGQNILAFSINDLERSLAKSPWIAELSIRRVLPDGIKINIREREPSYWVKKDGEIIYADELGTFIAPFSSGSFSSSYPLLEIESGAERFSARLPELVQNLESLKFPISVRRASSIKLCASRSLELNLDNGLKLSVGLDGWNANLDNLVRVLEDLSRRGELKNAAEIKAQGKGVWVAARRHRA